MKNISVLFVDDDKNILEGLKRKLYSKRSEWELAFKEGGLNAIEYMKTHPVDIIITDMRMPGVSGLDLLNHVNKVYPETIRIILSGHAEKTVVLQSIGLAHQYFSKPANTDDIIEAIYQIISVRKALKQPEMLKTFTQMRSIPCLPTIYHKIMDMLQSDDISMKSIGDLIMLDIGLSAKILQLINSSFFSVGKKIIDIYQAINLLGLDTLRDLILTIQIFDQVDHSNFLHFHLRELWKHSISTAKIAKWVANELGFSKEDCQSAFISGLLHDSGKLILANEFPVQYNEIILELKKEKGNWEDIEKKVFHVSHSDVIAYLTSIWGFSNSIVHSLLFHNRPQESQSKKVTILTCLYIADYIQRFISKNKMHELREFVNLIDPIIDMDYLKTIGFSKDINKWIEEIQLLEF